MKTLAAVLPLAAAAAASAQPIEARLTVTQGCRPMH
jgi:hypothetical protein